jgi:hypothetical protein
MNLSRPPAQYDAQDQTTLRDSLTRADAQNHKRGADIEVGAGARVVLTDTVTKTRYALTVSGGALTLTPA